MVHNQVYGMLFVSFVHVDGIHEQYIECKGLAIHPRSKETGLSGWFPGNLNKRFAYMIIYQAL
jgi:hypothetical protein